MSASSQVLLEDATYLVAARGRIVWCHLRIPPRFLPQQGAKVAQTLGAYLLGEVLHERTRWLGLVLDVVNAPSVFGPDTFRVVERMFKAAEHSKRPVAVVVGQSFTQREQFQRMQRDYAPRYSSVVDSADAARDWVIGYRAELLG